MSTKEPTYDDAQIAEHAPSALVPVGRGDAPLGAARDEDDGEAGRDRRLDPGDDGRRPSPQFEVGVTTPVLLALVLLRTARLLARRPKFV